MAGTRKCSNPLADGLFDKKDELSACWRRIYDAQNAIKALNENSTYQRIASAGNRLDINNAVVALKAVNESLKNEEKIVNDRLNEVQSSCEHDWVEEGHDSHKTHYVCSKCGATDYI